jgi:predicted CoA-binding protein
MLGIYALSCPKEAQMNKNVAIVGATEDPTKYANRALHMLQSRGYNPIPVNPLKETVDGIKCYPSLRDIPEPVDTVTMYVRPAVAGELADDVVAVKPRRVIMNPGTKSDVLADACKKNGIEVLYACTLILLQTGQ